MIPRPISEVSAEDLQRLVDNGVREGVELEYKQKQPEKRGERKNFLKEITSFANTSGGDLVIGIEERDQTGEPKSAVGVDVGDVDKEVGRLDSIIRDGVDPRIPSVEIRGVELPSGKTAFVTRVRQSLRRPHQVVLGRTV